MKSSNDVIAQVRGIHHKKILFIWALPKWGGGFFKLNICMVRYDKHDELWKMRHTRKVNFLATSRASESSLLLGSHFWVVHNDSAKCSNEEKSFYTTSLILHACNSEHFACSNAFCIMMEERCDGKEDCIDGTDEQDCGTLIIRKGYKKKLTPIPQSGQDVNVNFSINILDIEINEPIGAFTVKKSFTRDWFDGRLMFKNLKRGSGMNMNNLLPEESEAIWFPYLVLNNIENVEDIKETEVTHIHRVIPNDDFTYVAKDNMHIFKGSENRLSQTMEFSVVGKCKYAYHWYPFDTQVCRMEFISSKEGTDIFPNQLQYRQNISLDRYTLSRIRMCRSSILTKNAIIVEVMLGRPIISNLLTVFVPTILLLTISFTTRVFAADHIEMVIEVNLTVLLVEATM